MKRYGISNGISIPKNMKANILIVSARGQNPHSIYSIYTTARAKEAQDVLGEINKQANKILQFSSNRFQS